MLQEWVWENLWLARQGSHSWKALLQTIQWGWWNWARANGKAPKHQLK